MLQYSITGASVLGYSHRVLEYNNQDALNYYKEDDLIIGIVTDGCGSGHFSEAGSLLANRFILDYCKKNFKTKPFDIQQINTALRTFLISLIRSFPLEKSNNLIDHYLLFTIVGFVMQPANTHIFHQGDGLFGVNRDLKDLDEGNRPDYYTYHLFDPAWKGMACHRYETNDIKTLFVGSDGLSDLFFHFIKSSKEAGFSFSEFFAHEEFFNSPASLDKYLVSLAKDEKILHDDTSIIMVKRDEIAGN